MAGSRMILALPFSLLAMSVAPPARAASPAGTPALRGPAAEATLLAARKKKVRAKPAVEEPPPVEEVTVTPAAPVRATPPVTEPAPPAKATTVRAGPTVAPAVQAAEELRPAPTARRELGAMLGLLAPLSDDGALSAFKLRGEGFWHQGEVAPRLTLLLGATVGLSRGSEEDRAVIPTGVASTSTLTVSTSVTTFDLVGAGRLLYAFRDKVDFWAEGGLGLMYIGFRGRVDVSPSWALIDEQDVSDSTWAPEVRVAAGASYGLGDRLRVSAEIVGLSFIINTERAGVGSLYSLMVGGSYAL